MEKGFKGIIYIENFSSDARETEGIFLGSLPWEPNAMTGSKSPVKCGDPFKTLAPSNLSLSH